MLSKELMAYLSKYGEELDVVKKEEKQIRELVDIQCVNYAYVPIKIDKE